MSTLLDKVWRANLVLAGAANPDLLYCGRHLVHEVTSPQAFAGLRRAGRKVRRPDLTFAVMDHVVPTLAPQEPLEDPVAAVQIQTLRDNCAEFGITLLEVGDPRQGIVHVAAPELGVTLPGLTIFCGDSHTATHGAFGALAFGIGTSEVEHVLATQTLNQKKPLTLGVRLDGARSPGVSAKDFILAVIGALGAGGGAGYIIEYYGPAARALSMEGRMTMCNMSIECGAKAGMIAPDDITFDYLQGRAMAPKGADWDASVQAWRELKTDEDTSHAKEISLDASAIVPQVTWGTTPAQVTGIDGNIPDPASLGGAAQQEAAMKALEYMGLTPGTRMSDIAIDAVFIGSCTNGRIEDLRAAASVLRGKKIVPGLRALVVPGSGAVKEQAEAEGLDQVFKEAGMEWRLPGCSMCLAMNPDHLEPGQRCASTSNRNFQDRQGRGGRTHLVSPATAAASAIVGRFVDVRDID